MSRVAATDKSLRALSVAINCIGLIALIHRRFIVSKLMKYPFCFCVKYILFYAPTDFSMAALLLFYEIISLLNMKTLLILYLPCL